MFALHDLDIVAMLMRERYDVLWLHGYHTVTHIAAALTQRALGGSRLFREDQTLLHRLEPIGKRSEVSRVYDFLFAGSFGLFVGTENRRWFARWGIPETGSSKFPTR